MSPHAHPATDRARRAAVAVVAAAIVALAPAAAGASTGSPMSAARRALSLSDARLSLMRSVMASKWQSRAPVQDRAQEQAILSGARDAARRRGLGAAGVAAVFEAEISTAKTVQLGWGRQWLLHGFPAAEPAPDIAQVRARLADLSPRIIDALAELDGLRCRPGARATLLRDSRRLLRTRFVTDRARANLVDALLQVHGRKPCRHAGRSAASNAGPCLDGRARGPGPRNIGYGGVVVLGREVAATGTGAAGTQAEGRPSRIWGC
jgi:chorismate mutase